MFIPLLVPAIVVAASLAQPAAPAPDNAPLDRLAGIWAFDYPASVALLDPAQPDMRKSLDYFAQTLTNTTWEFASAGTFIARYADTMQECRAEGVIERDGAIRLTLDAKGAPLPDRAAFTDDDQIVIGEPDAPLKMVWRRICRTDADTVATAERAYAALLGRWNTDVDATRNDPDFERWSFEDRAQFSESGLQSYEFVAQGVRLNGNLLPLRVRGLGPDGAVALATDLGPGAPSRLFRLNPSGPDIVRFEMAPAMRIWLNRAPNPIP